MKKSLSIALQKKSDEFILHGISRLIATDRKRKADFLAYLNEVGTRKLYAAAGYSGLCEWLVEVHHMSESSALKRSQVAALTAKYPFLYESVSRGEYSLTSLGRLAPFVNGKNSALLFRLASFKSVRKVEAILADMFPKVEVEEKLQKSVSPLGLDRHSVQFTADTEFVKDLEEAKALLSHRFPQARLKDVLGLALKTLIQEVKRPRRSRKTAPQSTPHIPQGIQSSDIPRGMSVSENSDMPRGIQVSGTSDIPRGTQVPRSRHIPAATRRFVEGRDGRRCQHKRPDGTLCGATRFLEVDHVQEFALGGGHTPPNLRLLCWAHNALRAELKFGRRDRRPPVQKDMEQVP